MALWNRPLGKKSLALLEAQRQTGLPDGLLQGGGNLPLTRYDANFDFQQRMPIISDSPITNIEVRDNRGTVNIIITGRGK